jgi:hypothetical protein
MSLTYINDKTLRGTYIEFVEFETPEKMKTKRWGVYTLEGRNLLGWVVWLPAWRKYAYGAAPQSYYEEKCMTEIIEFITTKTEAHREKRKAEKAMAS